MAEPVHHLREGDRAYACGAKVGPWSWSWPGERSQGVGCPVTTCPACIARLRDLAANAETELARLLAEEERIERALAPHRGKVPHG